MVTLLIKLFTKEDMTENAIREKTGEICGIVGIIINVILFVIKGAAGLISGSVAITADAFNNLSDAGGSIVTYLGFNLASKKPDAEHPYGHGRMEYIAGFIVATLIMATAISLIKDSIDKIIHPETIIFNRLIAVILIVSILAKIYMAFYNYRIGKKINSAVMHAVAVDGISDVIATSVVFLTSVIVSYTGINIDGYCGILVGLLIAWQGIGSAKETINPLLGKPPEKEFVDRITDITLNFSEYILGMHDLIVHDYGPGKKIISLHAEVPTNADILRIHEVIDDLEHTLGRELGCIATVHMDPIVTGDSKVLALKKQVTDIIKGIDSTLGIHDFRVVFDDTHTNLFFDVQVPLEYKITNDELKKEIQEKIWDKLGMDCFAVMDFDRSYCL